MRHLHLARLTLVLLAGFTTTSGALAIAYGTADDPQTTPPATSATQTKAPTKPIANRESQQKALQEFASLIGEWRGVGQPKRGSSRGAWSEKAEWIWDFSKTGVSIHSKIEKGKLAKSIRIRPGKTTDHFLIELEPPEGKTATFKMKRDEKNLVGESTVGEDGYVQRLTLTQLNEKRTLLLLEKRKESQTFYSRIAGIGYTRAGTSLAVAGNTGPVCVVTGGKGTIAVYHKGKKYYVCCSGCKTAFDDDPEGILADYRESLKAKPGKKQKTDASTK